MDIEVESALRRAIRNCQFDRPDKPFELTKEHADAINVLLPTCEYVVGIRKNETGEVRFCPQHTEWIDSDEEFEEISPSLYWWSTGNMSCDCNRELDFRRQVDPNFNEYTECGEKRYTVVGIWFPNGDSYRDLNDLNDF